MKQSDSQRKNTQNYMMKHGVRRYLIYCITFMAKVCQSNFIPMPDSTLLLNVSRHFFKTVMFLDSS